LSDFFGRNFEKRVGNPVKVPKDGSLQKKRKYLLIGMSANDFQRFVFADTF